MTEADNAQGNAGDGGCFKLHVLASGSAGNAAIVETRGQAVLIDCGITRKAFFERCEAVGFDPATLAGVIVTHEHSDHTKGMGVTLRGLAKKDVRPPVYCTRGTLENSRELLALQDDAEVRVVPNSAELQVGNMRIQLFPSSHDAADPIGMAFETATGQGVDTLGYLTDTGVLPEAVPNLFARARILALEANHDPQLLAEGPYPGFLKHRITSARGHLSNGQSAEALALIAPTRLEAVCGMHLSKTNNRHNLALEAFESIGTGFRVHAAWQDRPLTIS